MLWISQKVRLGVSSRSYGNFQMSFLTNPMQLFICFLFFMFLYALTFCISFTFHTFIASISHLFTRSACVNLLAVHSSFHWLCFHSFFTFLVYLRTQFLPQSTSNLFILSCFTWLVHSSAHLWMCSIHHFILSFIHYSLVQSFIQWFMQLPTPLFIHHSTKIFRVLRIS